MGKHIRLASPLDMLSFGVPPTAELRCDLARQLLSPHHPLRELLASWLRPHEPCHTLLLWEDKRLLSCAQAQACPQNASWQLRYLAVWKAARAATAGLWEELLIGLGAEAGRRQVTRLLAYVPGEEYLEMFQRVGFSPFAEETILRSENASAAVAPPFSAFQPVQAENLWAIQQLYLSLTPPIVQQAEGYSSDSWQPQRDEEGWIWQEGALVRAYLRRWRGPRGTRLDLLLDPAYRQHAAELLAHALDGAATPAYLVLRSYQGELLEVARRVGFRPCARQVLLAKYLTIRQEVRQPQPVRAPERSLEPAPSAPSVGQALFHRNCSPRSRRTFERVNVETFPQASLPLVSKEGSLENHETV
jgi:hypothetical protein